MTSYDSVWGRFIRMVTQHIQERLSFAYLYAVSGRAGLLMERPTQDFGVDAQLRRLKSVRGGLVPDGVVVDVQLKATALWEVADSEIIYDLDAAAFNKISSRQPGEIPFYLFVLCLPKDAATWLGLSEDQLIIRNCCYWFKSSGPETQNTSSVRIRIPRSNILTVESIAQMMADARAELF